MKNSMRFLGLFLAVSVLLPGCIHVPTYQRKSLKSVSHHCPYHSAEKNVIVRAKLLSRADKKVLFGSHSRLIYNNDLQVIYISAHNLSGVHYLFSPGDIGLLMIPYHDVVRLMKTSSAGRLTGGGVNGLFSYSFGVTALFTIGDMGISSLAVAAAFMAPSVVCGALALTFLGASIKSIVMNSRITKDIKEKILHGSVVIPSGEQHEGIVFVKGLDYSPTFVVTMHEQDDVNNAITFDVDLRQNEQ